MMLLLALVAFGAGAAVRLGAGSTENASPLTARPEHPPVRQGFKDVPAVATCSRAQYMYLRQNPDVVAFDPLQHFWYYGSKGGGFCLRALARD